MLSIYLGGINLSQCCLPHGFILHVYILGKTSSSPLSIFKPQPNQGHTRSRVLNKGRMKKLTVSFYSPL